MDAADGAVLSGAEREPAASADAQCRSGDQGVIPAQSVSRLQEMGDWVRANGESIYGTSASPYGLPAWGRYTARPSAGKVYAHVFDWPKDHKLALTGLSAKPKSAYLLADRKPLAVEQVGDGFVVTLPSVAPSSIASVVVVETQ